MAVLLCASASFAKQALDEEEMDLVTAAGQPSIIDIEVTTTGVTQAVGTTETTSEVSSVLDSTNQTNLNDSVGQAVLDSTAFAGGLGLDVEFPLGPIAEILGGVALNIDVSDADIDTFSLSVASGSVGTLTATTTASASSSMTGASASVTAMNEDTSAVTLLVSENSQSDLRALVVNNIVGENQIANGMNIRSGAASTSDDSDQSNTITQSWGSSYDWTFAEGASVAGVAGGDASADATGGNGGSIGDNNNKGACILSDGCNSQSADGSGGSIGDVTGGVAAQGVGLAHLPLTISSDKIARVVVNSTGNAVVDVGEMDASAVSVVVDTGSQTNLASLVVNNIGGKNQIATGFNVAANGSVSIGSTGSAVLFDSQINGSANYGGGQSNTINQFRGTPYK